MKAPTPPDVRELVDRTLADAVRQRASDLHVEPTAQGFELRLRIDGLLQTIAKYDQTIGRSIVGRLMVMSQLLTYRLDVPQEGRMEMPIEGQTLHLRVSVMPTTHGLRAAVRMPAELLQPKALDDLGLPEPTLAALRSFANSDSGMLIVTGPAGSGKTTTIYALLAQIKSLQPGLSVISLEDPVERDVPGVTQIEVKPFGELTYERALRSMLRQDPQVLALGEIRDATTASIAVQAALSGHRLVCTLHASSPVGGLARLVEMGIEPYQVSSAVFGIVSQRLVRRRDAAGNYRGRVPIAQTMLMDAAIRKAILEKADSQTVEQIASRQPGFQSLQAAAEALVAQGLTDQEEVSRVLGQGDAR